MEHKAFSTLAVLLPEPFWSRLLPLPSDCPIAQPWAAAPKATCLWTDAAPTLHVCATPTSYWPPNGPQLWGTKHGNVQRTIQKQTANNKSAHNSLTRSLCAVVSLRAWYTKCLFQRFTGGCRKWKMLGWRGGQKVSCWNIYTFSLSCVIYWC